MRAQDLPNQFEGQPIVSVAFEPARQPLELNEIADILPLKKDTPYRATLVRSAIERLYGTGRYQDIQVDATASGAGIALRFITKNSWFVGTVATETNLSEPPTTGQIVSTAQLTLGAPFDEDQLVTAEQNIHKLLVADGYFRPQISHRLEYNEEYQQVKITFVVKAGKRFHYSAPEVSGDTSVLSAKEIDKATKWKNFLLPGYRGITQSRSRTGVDNVRLKYQNANRLRATVTLEGLDENNTKPRLVVEPGPLVEVKAEGAKVSRKTLKQQVPVFEEHTVDADLLAEGSNNLRDYFQAQGYFEVDVEYEQQAVRDGKTQIDYLITTGIRHRLIYVGIDGNKYFNQKTLRERMYLIPSSFEFRRGRYSEASRRRDEGSIADLYRSNGFRDVKVQSRTEDDYKGKTGDFAVFFTITEGMQYTVSLLKFEGVEKLDLSKTLQSVSSQAGQVFSEFNIASDRETIMQQYGANGFANATFAWDSKIDAETHLVELTFTIHEGEQQFVRDVVTTGLATTRPNLVTRQLRMHPGDPLSPSAMADTQKRLYDLGIFAQVEMAIQNPDGEEKQKYVLFDLEEARRYSITFGFGAEFARIGGSNAVTDLSDPGGSPGFSPRVSLDLTRLNFFGTGQSVSFRSRLSTLQKRANISYFIPRVFSLPKFDATFSILYDDTHDVRTFQSKREEASAQFVHHVSKPITVFYRFNYRNVGVSNLKIDPLLLPRLAQSVRVGVASFNLVQDRRDDPIDPHKGIYNTLDVGWATRFFGSQTSFVRVLARNATYYRLGEKIVLARETQVGVEPAYRVPANADPSDPIPLPERFYGGGGNTLRGVPENQAGPRDVLTGFPLGGSAVFFNNTELRFPLYGANINGVIFEDAGNIFSNWRAMTLRAVQNDVKDFDYMVHALGFGIRYRTPVGPLRFDLAYSINPPKYNGFAGSYVQLVQCSMQGNCQASLQQISHFQFFFSIGQAF
ncbi:MAG: outer membrane protein insertion porin family [Bryobacterales bacterium]|nr:outer membrane protein insertion porin family [Bryobacterales bacterium]